MSHPVVVVGAGLSGLYASHLLAQAGQHVLLVEARERLGGRILSQGPTQSGHRVDLGPSWFWPGMNPRTQRLLAKLGLASFPQHTHGAAVIEGRDGKLLKHQSAWEQTPSSYRIAGGTQALTDALAAQLGDHVHVQSQTRVHAMKMRPHAVELSLEDARGRWQQLATQAILTLPPRLMAQDVAFEPAWPEAVVKDMRATPTWMAGQAKFVAAYPSAFWREAGLSGDGMSHRGPLSEIHDASDASGEVAALFGFVGASPSYRGGIGHEALKAQAMAQLVRMFGAQAANPVWTALQDWAQEPLTAAKEDQRPLGHHPLYEPAEVPPPWAQRVWLAGTERSPNYGGYIEGALEAAELAVQGFLENSKTPGRHGVGEDQTIAQNLATTPAPASDPMQPQTTGETL
jgi:monoamine oxidase